MSNVIVIALVLVAFIVFYLLFNKLKASTIDRNKNRIRPEKETPATPQTPQEEVNEPGEVFAAIAMALHEYQDNSHDLEDTVLTINRVARAYSPWSSKIYGLRQFPGAQR